MACWRNTVRMNSHNNSRKTSARAVKSTGLLDQLREHIRDLHYSLRTEEVYAYGVKKFIDVYETKHQRDMSREQEAALVAKA